MSLRPATPAVALVLMMSALIGEAPSAFACRNGVPRLSAPAAYDAADIVVEARFVAGSQRPGGEGAETELAITKSWKGNAANTLMLKSRHDTCSPYPFFRKDSHYLVYLKWPTDGVWSILRVVEQRLIAEDVVAFPKSKGVAPAKGDVGCLTDADCVSLGHAYKCVVGKGPCSPSSTCGRACAKDPGT
jgi:hypothetical protein